MDKGTSEIYLICYDMIGHNDLILRSQRSGAAVELSEGNNN